METNGNENKEKVAQPSDFQKFKQHMVKHKKKYILGGVAVLSFAVGFSLGNRGNSKRHYSKLLKDGVKDAVRDGIKDVIDRNMREVVKDGMEDVVTDVVNNAVHDHTVTIVNMVNKNSIKHTVATADAVKSAIKDSAVTIIKEVEKEVEKDDSVTEFYKEVLDRIKEQKKELKFRYDSDGNVHAVID